ncbi:hypothetical protein PUNSTDRAFT_139688 [Punctularia strigosozonata HHB-11173 SS5]|uniref:Uncharacterized protein n=1 Tax=Punctularia strigosozonata (strain HHB-11173) TaxID=741275 RepID=R7RZ86_PUNST|nr:uncharacterized protein PUNSTDRAFT_139688 [Punctularia strigosozonata HHB-11173 SS5]EIN03288.1 hypothetical protein PUNSTDRAFT_139688 [Punctularia strigosozonata HHB-11173 SS5]
MQSGLHPPFNAPRSAQSAALQRRTGAREVGELSLRDASLRLAAEHRNMPSSPTMLALKRDPALALKRDPTPGLERPRRALQNSRALAPCLLTPARPCLLASAHPCLLLPPARALAI